MSNGEYCCMRGLQEEHLIFGRNKKQITKKILEEKNPKGEALLNVEDIEKTFNT